MMQVRGSFKVEFSEFEVAFCIKTSHQVSFHNRRKHKHEGPDTTKVH